MKSLIIIFAALMTIQAIKAQDVMKFRHILITNDDGIEDKARLLKLAQNVKQVADRVSIVVPDSDRSGTSNYTTFGKYKKTLEVTCVERITESNIAVYTVPGNPADCVLLGLLGMFGDDKPDLVLSGINSGSNTGPEWIGSGTIGAIRMAAFLGVKGIALSGYQKDNIKYCDSILEWIVEFISGGVTDQIGRNNYLTIAFPAANPGKVKGVKIADRRIAFENPDAVSFHKTDGDDAGIPGNRTEWSLNITGNPVADPYEFDDVLLRNGYVVITPMTIDENNFTGIDKLKNTADVIPSFPSE